MAICVNGINVSYDYTELIQELESDIKEGLTEEYIFIEREFNKDLEPLNYKPIVDYYYTVDEIPKNVEYEKILTKEVLKEMKKWSSII